MKNMLIVLLIMDYHSNGKQNDFDMYLCLYIIVKIQYYEMQMSIGYEKWSIEHPIRNIWPLPGFIPSFHLPSWRFFIGQPVFHNFSLLDHPGRSLNGALYTEAIDFFFVPLYEFVEELQLLESDWKFMHHCEVNVIFCCFSRMSDKSKTLPLAQFRCLTEIVVQSCKVCTVSKKLISASWVVYLVLVLNLNTV